MSDFPALPFLSCEGYVMAKILYRIVAEVPGSYAVEVKDHGLLVHFELGFMPETEAEAWVATQANPTRGIDQWEHQIEQPRRR